MTLQIKKCLLSLQLRYQDGQKEIEQTLQQMVQECFASFELEASSSDIDEEQGKITIPNLKLQLPHFRLDQLTSHFKTEFNKSLTEALEKACEEKGIVLSKKKHSNQEISLSQEKQKTPSPEQEIETWKVLNHLFLTGKLPAGIQIGEQDLIAKWIFQGIRDGFNNKKELIDLKRWLQGRLTRQRLLDQLKVQHRLQLADVFSQDVYLLANLLSTHQNTLKEKRKNYWSQLFYLMTLPKHDFSSHYQCLSLEIRINFLNPSELSSERVQILETLKRRLNSFLTRPSWIKAKEILALQIWLMERENSSVKPQDLDLLENLVLQMENSKGRQKNLPKVRKGLQRLQERDFPRGRASRDKFFKEDFDQDESGQNRVAINYRQEIQGYHRLLSRLREIFSWLGVSSQFKREQIQELQKELDQQNFLESSLLFSLGQWIKRKMKRWTLNEIGEITQKIEQSVLTHDVPELTLLMEHPQLPARLIFKIRQWMKREVAIKEKEYATEKVDILDVLEHLEVFSRHPKNDQLQSHDDFARSVQIQWQILLVRTLIHRWKGQRDRDKQEPDKDFLKLIQRLLNSLKAEAWLGKQWLSQEIREQFIVFQEKPTFQELLKLYGCLQEYFQEVVQPNRFSEAHSNYREWQESNRKQSITDILDEQENLIIELQKQSNQEEVKEQQGSGQEQQEKSQQGKLTEQERTIIEQEESRQQNKHDKEETQDGQLKKEKQSDHPKQERKILDLEVYQLESSLWEKLEKFMPKILAVLCPLPLDLVQKEMGPVRWFFTDKMVPDRVTLYQMLAQIHSLLSIQAIERPFGEIKVLQRTLLQWQNMLEPEVGENRPLATMTWWQEFCEKIGEFSLDLLSLETQKEKIQKLAQEAIHNPNVNSLKQNLKEVGFPAIHRESLEEMVQQVQQQTLISLEQKTLQQAISSAKSEEEKLNREQKLQQSEELLTEDAGLVILWPFLKRFFEQYELLNQESDAFRNEECQLKAHALLVYLLGKEETSFSAFVIANLLVGLEMETIMEQEILLSSEEKMQCDRLLDAIIIHWSALKHMPKESFQTLFLQRQANCKMTETGWRIQVEHKAMDVLLSKLPWSISLVKPSWLGEHMIHVEWKTGLF